MEELEGVPQGCPRPYLWAQEPEPAYQRCLHHRVEIFLTIVVGFFEVCGVLNVIFIISFSIWFIFQCDHFNFSSQTFLIGEAL